MDNMVEITEEIVTRYCEMQFVSCFVTANYINAICGSPMHTIMSPLSWFVHPTVIAYPMFRLI